MNKIYEENDYMVLVIIKDQTEYQVKFDKEDLPNIQNSSWHLHHAGYACNNQNIAMHLVIMNRYKANEKDSLVIDHINQDKLDNRKSNLRITTRSVNSTNAKVRSDKTQLDLPRGIVYRPENPELRADGRGQKRYESFEVQWSIDGKRKSKTFSVKKFGSYEKAKEAAIKFRQEKLEEMKIQSRPMATQE